jgi:AcrR family transcriptional regulator
MIATSPKPDTSAEPLPKIVDHEERRDRISQAACGVIASVPLDRLTLRDIAAAAGCTTGAVTHYFADKGQVLDAALDWVIRSREKRLEYEFRDGAADLRRVLCQHLPLDPERVVESRVMCAFIGKAYNDDRLSEKRRSRAAELHVIFRRTLEFCRTNGSVSPDCDTEREAELLLDLIMGISMRTSLDPECWPPAKQLEHLDAYLEKLGQAVAARAVPAGQSIR